MQLETTLRMCSTCKRPLPINEDGLQQGFICCDEYYCNELCLAKGTGFRSHYEWEQVHYTEDGQCCWTEWELEELA